MKVGKLAINGYYGMGNAGDEAVLACALAQIRKADPSIDVTVLSGDPDATSGTYSVKSVPRKGFAALKAISSSELYVSGGGSLLQDTTSAGSVLYYLALMAASKLACRKYAVFANGIGPISRGWARNMVRMAVDGASSVSVRDAGSSRFLESIGVRRRDVLLSADPVFAIRPRGAEEVLSAVGKASGPAASEYLRQNTGRLAIIALRSWRGLDGGTVALCSMADVLRKAGFAPVGLAFQPGNDEEPTRSALNRCGDDVPVIACSFHPEITAGMFSLAGVTVGMRLHSLIMSAAAGVPAFGISYDPKVDALYEMLPLGRCVSVEKLSSEGEGALEDMLKSLDSYRARLSSTLPSVRQRAEGAAEFMLRKAEGR